MKKFEAGGKVILIVDSFLSSRKGSILTFNGILIPEDIITKGLWMGTEEAGYFLIDDLVPYSRLAEAIFSK